MLTLLFLQAQQVIQVAPQEPVNSSTLLYAIAAALVAVGGLIAWFIKSTVPKIIDQAEKRTDALTKAVEGFPKAIEGLKEAIDGIKQLSNDIRNDIKIHVSSEVGDAKETIVRTIEDVKFKNLVETIERRTPPPISPAAFTASQHSSIHD